MADLGPNDGLRFGLELAALGVFGYWGWTAVGGPLRYLLAVGLPLVAALLWGTFRVPGDPGDAPVAVPGPVRLGLEAGLFLGATVALAGAASPGVAAGFGLVVVVHYLAARARVRWLLGWGSR